MNIPDIVLCWFEIKARGYYGMYEYGDFTICRFATEEEANNAIQWLKSNEEDAKQYREHFGIDDINTINVIPQHIELYDKFDKKQILK